MASKGKKLSKKEIRTAAGKQRKREQRTAVAEASQGAETLDPGATTPSGECWMWMCGVVDLTLPSLRFAASSPRTPATKQTRRGSPDSPSSPNPSQTKRREHGDIAPVPGVEEEKPTGASGNQATTLVAADCTGANADGRGGPMQTLSEGLASLSTADRAAPATTKVHSAHIRCTTHIRVKLVGISTPTQLGTWRKPICDVLRLGGGIPKGIKRCREVLLFAGNRGGECGTSRVDSRKRTCLSTDLDFFISILALGP